MPELLARRLESDPDGEYLDVCGVKTSAADVADAAGRIAGALARLRGRTRRPRRLAHRELERGDAGVVGDRRGRRAWPSPSTPPTRASTCATSWPTPAPGCSSSSPTSPTGPSGSSTRSRRSSTWWSWATPSRTIQTPQHRWDELLAADPQPFADVRPGDLATFIYTGGTTGLVEGLHAQPRLPRHAVPADRGLLAAHRRRRGVDAAAAVPLQRHRHGRARPARLRRPRRDLPAVLRVELLVGDEPRRRHDHLDARHDGVPPRQRHRSSRAAALGCARGQHDAAAARRRPAPGGDRPGRSASGSASTPSPAPTASPRPRWCRGSRRASRTGPTPPA